MERRRSLSEFDYVQDEDPKDLEAFSKTLEKYYSIFQSTGIFFFLSLVFLVIFVIGLIISIVMSTDIARVIFAAVMTGLLFISTIILYKKYQIMKQKKIEERQEYQLRNPQREEMKRMRAMPQYERLMTINDKYNARDPEDNAHDPYKEDDASTTYNSARSSLSEPSHYE